MRYWLLTNTTYGTWLPGDRRGSVASVRDRRPEDGETPFRFEHDLPGIPFEEEIPGLRNKSVDLMKGPPIYLDREKAEIVLVQFLETARFRNWAILAASIMRNHFHLVVQVEGDPSPKKVLGDFKAYATRTLNGRYGKPASESWWTVNGSKRKLVDERAIAAAIHYVLYRQPHPLVVWSPENDESGISGEPGASATGGPASSGNDPSTGR